MIAQEINRVSDGLRDDGHVLTSFDRLGIEGFDPLARALRDVVESTPHFIAEQAASPNGMIMCKDKQSKAAGSALVRPIVDVLFSPEQSREGVWDMYTVNYYFEAGHFFKPHQDYLDEGTVVIMTAAGRRQLDIFQKEEEDDLFKEVAMSYELSPGEVLLLDGARDLGHAAMCLEGPSISVVGDVPGTVSRV